MAPPLVRPPAQRAAALTRSSVAAPPAWVLGAAAVAAGALAFETGYGAPLGDALLYLAYEAGFVVLPGWLAYRALSHQCGGPLRQLTLGWALGYVLEVLAFMLTAATGTRSLFVIYPLVVAAAALGRIVRRRPAPAVAAEARISRRLVWLVTAVCLAAIAYVGLSYFPGSPLPGTRTVAYFLDYPRWISLAADAKHHWPITDPSVSGEPLPYHYFVNIHLAAASQVTGLGLPLIYFRLFIFPMVVLLVLEFLVAGRSLARSAHVGLVAACLAIFIGELRLDSRHLFIAHTPFFGLFFTYLFRSPSFLLGLVIFVPLVILLGERLADRDAPARFGDWCVIALLMVGASDAKVTILPLLLLALLLYSGWRWLVERRIPAAAWLGSTLALLVIGTVWALQYRGHPSELHLRPFATFQAMPAVGLVKGYFASALPAFPAKSFLLSAGGIAFGLLGLLTAQLVGVFWIFRRVGHRLSGDQAWLLTVLVAGLVLALTLSEPGTENELYFLFYGVAAGCILSAGGIRLAWLSRPSLAGRAKRLSAMGLAWVVVLAVLMVAPLRLHLFAGPHRQPQLYALWYVAFAVAVVLMYVIARRWIGPTRWAAAALACAAALSVGVLDTPIDNLQPVLAGPGVASVNQLFKPMSPELYRTLNWIREKTPSSSVLAVNNQWLGPDRTVPYEFNYSAFAERRVFLEGWEYSQAARDRGYANADANPFPGRLALNDAAFRHGDRAALHVMAADYGVRYLLIDRAGGYRTDLPALLRAARIVHRTPATVVLKLR